MYADFKVRMWALYLGRPYSIKLDDVTVSHPGFDADVPSWDMLMSAAWTSLFDIVGHMCDALSVYQPANRDSGADFSRNGKLGKSEHVNSLNQQLLAWEAHLHETIQYSPGCPPSVCGL